MATRKADAANQKAEAEQNAEADALENTITQDAAEADRIKAEANAASKTPVLDRDDGIQAAHDAEIQRQHDQEEAVRDANAQLRDLGGPELNPGNPDLSTEE